MGDDKEREKIFQAQQEFPRWIYSPTGAGSEYIIDWNPPYFYQRHADKIWRCSKLQEIICEKVQQILDDKVFDYIEEVRLGFNEYGLGISVYPGDTCEIHPEIDDFYYVSHNIDGLSQCLSLFVILTTAIAEIYSMMYLWEINPELDLEDINNPVYYHLKRKNGGGERDVETD